MAKRAKPPARADLGVVFRDMRELVPYARNPRTHPPEQIAILKGLLMRLGWANAVKTAGDGILAGHGTIRAAMELAAEGKHPSGAPPWQAPCIDLSHLSSREQREFIIADNQIAAASGWDEALLRLELTDLGAAGDFDAKSLGFDQSFLDGLFGSADAGADLGALRVSLADRFGIPPFSVLDGRSGWWQARKRAWLALGIQSELGRGGNLLKMSDQVLAAQAGGDPYGTKRARKRAPAKEQADAA